MTKICDKIIKYSFYALFLLVPLVLRSDTSELFELNKMWLTWGITLIIAMSWSIKMILERKFFIQRSPLDIPIGFFLLSQVISTIFSLDPHTSLWGYYSRFNGGLLSTFSYIFLYYAFLSNFQANLLIMVKKSLLFSLISGLIVALWGFPSHFGYDPTCLIFRGNFDVSCWTADFLPKVRIFSTMGQPDWLAAYLAILIPISIAFFVNNLKSSPSEIDKKYQVSSIMYYVSNKSFIHTTYYILLTTLFYVDLLYTRARSGILGVWLSVIFFAAAYLFIAIKKQEIKKSLLIIPCIFLFITFIVGTPFGILRGFSLDGVGSFFQKTQTSKIVSAPTPTPMPAGSFESGGGGTESGNIRLLVWSGAINAWKNNPLFGTGVETFAFAYYKYKPAAQNLTSEWNYLYNKAHNEYLNYLATTGLFGLGTYLSMILAFFVLCIRYYVSGIKDKIHNTKYLILNTGLVAAYISILITNFFGFSVVITNIYLFMIPAFVFILIQPDSVLAEKNKPQTILVNKAQKIGTESSVWLWTPIFFVLIIGIFMLYSLFRFWQADIAYALGYNLDRAGQYQQAYPYLHKAVTLRGNEPVFKDELSINDAIIAAALVSQKSQDEKTKEQSANVASSLVQEAIDTSNEIISHYSNNAVFWKTRVRLFYTLSQVDSRYLPRALDTIEKASLLAPNDANISYNLGVLYGQNGNLQKGIETLEKTITIKSNYKDAHYALGLFYHTAALDKSGKVVVDENLNRKALAQMQYIVDHISPQDPSALSSLKSWAR
jgi:putative inorganic carbon (hco3(-)) transporter